MAITADSIMRLSPLQRIGILLLAVVLIVVGYWQLLHRPQSRRIQAQESRLSDLIRERNIKRDVAKNLEQFRAELEGLSVQFKEALAKLPDKKEIPQILSSISNLGKEAGLEVLRFKPQAETAGDFYARVPLDLRFVGSYHNLGMFFYKVGKVPRIVNIENFTVIKAPEDKGEQIALSATCTAATYRFLEQAAPAKPKPGSKQKKR